MNQDIEKKLRAFILDEFAKKLKEKINLGFVLKNFNINPFTSIALSSGVLGELNSTNLAKALIYPRVFGTSITTKYGDKMQKLCVRVFGAKPSGVKGMDIEYFDQVDGKEVIMQLKAGPNTINSEDVEPIINKMVTAYRLLKQNRSENIPLFAIGITYGRENEVSAHYKKISASSVAGQTNIPLFVGEDFWHRLTGVKGTYFSMIQIFLEIFEKEDYSESLNDSISKLSTLLNDNYFTKGKFDYKKL